MAEVTLGDVFARDRDAAYSVIQSYMDRDPVTQTPFFESGLVVSNPIISELAQSNTGIVELPYWGRLDTSIEPNYSNDQYQDIAVPQKLATDYLRARNVHMNEGWRSMDMVTELSGQDPLARVAGLLDNYWRKEAELRIVATLRGILNDAVAENNGMVHQATATAGITFEGLIDAQMTLGDAFGEIGGYVMNSTAFATLVKEGIAAVARTPDTNVLTRTLNGMPVIVNDLAMTLNSKPVVALIGPGAFAYGMGTPRVPLEYEREPDAKRDGQLHGGDMTEEQIRAIVREEVAKALHGGTTITINMPDTPRLSSEDFRSLMRQMADHAMRNR